MKLSKMIPNTPDIEIKTLFTDSREKVKSGMFFCIKGMMNDGHKFVDDAIMNGAICIVHSDSLKEYHNHIIYLQVDNVLKTLNIVTDIFYDHPSEKMTVYGITGTNGKSSIALTLKNLIDHFEPCGYMGTIAVEYGGMKLSPSLTTPDIIELHETLNEMVKADMKSVAMEVSSHGLEQGRIDAVAFDVAIFTNLTHDHLDFHGTMENYYHAKRKLFQLLTDDGLAIINADDDYGRRLISETEAKVVTYGIENPATYMASDIELFPECSTFTLECYEFKYQVKTNLVAKFNIYNLLAVLAAMHKKGYPLEEIIPLLENIKQIDGRMERIDEGQPFLVIVDYAHTPDGFEQIYEYAKSITPENKKIISVFGSAGKRDLKKRPVLGEISNRYSDMIVLTEEDPRGEDVTQICEEIGKGITTTNYIIIEDRYAAIRQAIEIANTDDTVLVLAKGDETYLSRAFGKEEWMGDDNAARDILHRYYLGEE